MHRYAIALVVVALGATATAASSAPPNASLTLTAAPGTIVSGHATTLSGRLSGGKVGGKKVDVQADFFPYEGKFAKVATATTAANGAWSATARPPINVRLRAHQGKTNSPVVTVRVRIRVSLKVSDSTPKAGRRVRFSGRACPQHDGALVRIHRRTHTKKWKTVKRTRLRDIPGSTCSRFSKRVRVRRDGRYRAYVVSSRGDNANGRSRSRRINVH